MSRGVIRGTERGDVTLPEFPVTVTHDELSKKTAIDVYMRGGELTVATTPTIKPPPSEVPTILPGEALSLAQDAEATLIDLLIPADKLCFLQFIEVSGENRGEFSVYIDGSRVSRKRTWWTAFNTTFEFCRGYSGLEIFPNSRLSVKVKNKGTGQANFDASAIYVLKDL